MKTVKQLTKVDGVWVPVYVEDDAADRARNIPGWATWSTDEALAWHDANIGDVLPVANLTEANAVLEKLAQENRALVQMVLALRDATWPNLAAD